MKNHVRSQEKESDSMIKLAGSKLQFRFSLQHNLLSPFRINILWKLKRAEVLVQLEENFKKVSEDEKRSSEFRLFANVNRFLF